MTKAARIEAACWGAALLCACSLLVCALEAHAARRQSFAPLAQAAPETESGAVLGRIEIPALGLEVPVVEDDDTKSLLRGLGHIRGTATIGGLGTTALAGHRDTFLRPIRHIARKMEILAISPGGTYRYVVDSMEIVTPEQVDVLDIRHRPELVLVTCYPFDYIGHAPKRFIVHAHLVSASPEALPASKSAESSGEQRIAPTRTAQ